MSYIDFDKLRRERTIDFFSLAPIDIQGLVTFAGEVMRDATRADAKAMAKRRVAVCRVCVSSPSPRLRQRLAILGWVPEVAGADGRWGLVEPVELQVGDSQTVAERVGKRCGEVMNALFSPDGTFSGGAFALHPDAHASSAERRRYVRHLAELAFIGTAVVTRQVSLSWFEHGVRNAVARDNAARARAGLPALEVPSSLALKRWLREFVDLHRDRPGIGKDWHNYEGGVATASDGS